MTLNNLSRHIRLIVRGELLMLQAKLSFAMKRSAFVGLALLFAGLGLVFINMGLFAWLLPLWGPVWTPAGLGLINLALAAVALAIATFVKPGPEMALAEEIRNMAADSPRCGDAFGRTDRGSRGRARGGAGRRGIRRQGFRIACMRCGVPARRRRGFPFGTRYPWT